MSKPKTHRVSPPTRLIFGGILFLALFGCLSSCNVTRTITTQSSAYQKGDTCITIQTKTTEVYDASKKPKL